MTWWIWLIIGFDVLFSVVTFIIFEGSGYLESWGVRIAVLITLLIFGIPLLLFGLFQWMIQSAIE